MGKLFVITSGKGGVGKSTIAAGVGTALASIGKKVLLIDMDEGLRCLDLVLGVADTTVFDLSDVLQNNKTIEETAISIIGFSNLSLIAAPAFIGMLDKTAFEGFINNIIKQFDYIILDCPAGIDRGFDLSLPRGAQALVAVTPDPVSVRDAAAVDLILDEKGITPRLMVINKFDKRLFKRGVFSNIDEIIDTSGLRLAAIIPNDERVIISAANGKPLTEGKASKAFYRLAMRLDGVSVPLPNIKKI